jgi:magnesium chelatase family protein
MRGDGTGACSEEIHGRAEGARAIQRVRGYYNSRVPTRMLRRLCELDDAGDRTLETAVLRLGLSARAHQRILKEKENVP